MQQAGSQPVTWIPLSDTLDNMLLYFEGQKWENEPQDFERFKAAVVQAAVNSAFLVPERLENQGTQYVCVLHTVTTREVWRPLWHGLPS